jgi:PAS domain S-box-containing protein
MQDEYKNKEQFINEVQLLRQMPFFASKGLDIEEDNQREVEAFLANILSSIPDAIIVVDKDLNILFANHAMGKWHFHKMPLLGKKCFEVLQDKKEPCLRCPAQETLLSGGKFRAVMPLMESDGQIIGWEEINSFPFMDLVTFQIKGAIVYVRDITKSKQMERALEDLLNFQQILIDSVPVPIFYNDTSGLFLGCNIAFENLIGQNREEMSNKSVYDLVPDELVDIFKENDIALLSNHQAQVEEFEFKEDNKINRVILLHKAVFPQPDGQPGGLIGAVIDVTERKQVEDKLRRAYDEVERLVRERTAELLETNIALRNEILVRQRAEDQIKASLQEKVILLREIHHRVKNNLQIISGLIELSSNRTQNREAQDLLKNAMDKINTMSFIHKQLYQSDRFDQIDLGIHMRELVQYLMQLYGSRGLSVAYTIDSNDVYLTVTQAIPCSLVLNEVISNALKHAFKGRENGQIDISIRRTDDERVIISVKDNGIGIPEEVDLEKANTLGLKLIRKITQQQLKGKIQIMRKDGTEIRIEFEITKEETKDG